MEWNDAGKLAVRKHCCSDQRFYARSKRIGLTEHFFSVSKIVETFTGYRIPANKPIVRRQRLYLKPLVFMLMVIKTIYILMIYFQNVLEEKAIYFRKRALKQISKRTLQELGLKLNQEDIKLVTQRIIELGDKKKTVTRTSLYI
jgi:D-citramalate synthase